MPHLMLPAQRPVDRTRRRFVLGLTAGGILAGIGAGSRRSFAASELTAGPPVLQGSRFDLTYSPLKVNFTGRERYATAINGSVPAPTLRWREGDTVTLKVDNFMAEDTSIHWHGIILPSGQDGVPHISDGFVGIPPGESFTYRFRVTQSGTFWYHSHSGFQEQTGAYGAIVIDPAAGDPLRYDRDYVVVLSDWTDEDPARVYAKLKKMSDYYNFRERTAADVLADLRRSGWSGFREQRRMWNEMRMSDRDISDVTGYTYTFLMNGFTPARGWTGLFRRGDRVRLRFINAAAMTFFDVRIPGLTMKVVAADGQNIEPVSVDEIRLGVAETYDVIVAPADDRAYTIFAQAIDRTGFARGTLTPDPALLADVPDMDPYPLLSHEDMGMGTAGMAGHDMAAMGAVIAAQPDPTVPGQDPHAGHRMPAASPTNADNATPLPGMGPVMAQDPHAGHAMPTAPADPHAGHNMAAMSSGNGPAPMGSAPAPGGAGSGMAGYGSNRPIVHAPSERPPYVDMRAEMPRYQLDDPGIGLRNNGRRVLTYADIFNLGPTPDPREPSRELDLHLTGNMSRYMWSLDGVRFADAEPIRFQLGERLRVNLINDTMMNHPMHLHGMWSDLETGDGARIPRKHTVIVQPGARLSFLVTADAAGPWAFHCHLIYHMPGMFRTVIVT